MITPTNSTFFSPSTGILPPEETNNQQLATTFIRQNNENLNKQDPMEFMRLFRETKTGVSNLNLSPLSMLTNPSRTYQDTMSSVKDIQQKMKMLSNYTSEANTRSSERSPYTNNSSSMANQISNSTINSTSIITDYLRNIRTDLQLLPAWRNYSG